MKSAVLILITLSAIGCQPVDSKRVPVPGTVTLHGQPLIRGSIALTPNIDVAGPAAGADIIDGRFSMPRERGPATGSHCVKVTIAVTAPASRAMSRIPKFGEVRMQTLDTELNITRDQQEYEINLP